MRGYYDSFETPLGRFAVAVNDAGAVVGAAFGADEALRGVARGVELVADAGRVRNVRRQLEEYFAGERGGFDVAVAAAGTPFQQRVWQALRSIPCGETRSYGELAATLGSSPRAVGGANGANPVCVIVPCHRVIGADGSLTGFAYGIEVKRGLLELERRFVSGRVATGAVGEVLAAEPQTSEVVLVPARVGDHPRKRSDWYGRT